MDREKARIDYRHHKWEANRRGIDFLFLFDEWVQWWEYNLGPDWQEKRGRKAGQYVMSRYRDTGSYHPSNVQCITASENHKEKDVRYCSGEGQWKSILTAAEAVEIFLSKGSNAEIARRFDVKTQVVHYIKIRHTWKHVTKDL